ASLGPICLLRFPPCPRAGCLRPAARRAGRLGAPRPACGEPRARANDGPCAGIL
ncbi:MAG: hypothetical protein AVDCRST_MAG73-1381, partial [uncultured Thermomicrobiales bacterium]